MIPELQKKPDVLAWRTHSSKQTSKTEYLWSPRQARYRGQRVTPRTRDELDTKLPQLQFPFTSDDTQPLSRVGSDDLHHDGWAVVDTAFQESAERRAAAERLGNAGGDRLVLIVKIL